MAFYDKVVVYRQNKLFGRENVFPSFFCIQVLFHYGPISLMLKLILTTKKAFGKNFCLSHEHERAF